MVQSIPSSAQLLMGRRIRTVVPEADGVLIPSSPNLTKFRQVDEQYNYKKKQRCQFERRHRARELPELEDDTEVFITDGRRPNSVPGRVIQSSGTRSYTVETLSITSRRSRYHLHQRSSDNSDIARPSEPIYRSPIQTRSTYIRLELF